MVARGGTVPNDDPVGDPGDDTAGDQLADPPAAGPDRERGLGRDYRKLWTAATISNLGDGIDNAALPLLAAALTRDPLLFAGVATANRLPWLLFSLHAGAIIDRVDRRRLMVVANAVRFLLMGALGIAVVADAASIWLLYVVALGLGTFEVLFDNAAQALMPAVVRRDQLEHANGRLFAGEIVTNQFAGPPLGAFLFGIAASLPILFDAGTFLVSAALIAAMSADVGRRHRTTARLAQDADAVARPAMRVEIVEGLRWLWRHRLLRTLAILLAAMNGTASFGQAIMALYVVGEGSILGLGPIGWGLLLTAGAAGSLVGSVVAAPAVARFGRARTLWSTLLAAIVTPLTIGATSNVWVVAVAFAVVGLSAVLWNVVTVSLRQSIIPDELLGRVNSVYRFLGWGAIPIGALLGGVIASQFGLRAPWFAAAAVMTVALVPAFGRITDAAIDEARG